MAVLYVVTVDVDPLSEREWDDWNTDHHIPEVLRVPGFLRASKYKVETAPGEWSRYEIAYEVTSDEALQSYFESPAVVRLRGDQTFRFGSVTRLSRRVMARLLVVDTPEPASILSGSSTSSAAGVSVNTTAGELTETPSKNP